jgi:hypothetical protein
MAAAAAPLIAAFQAAGFAMQADLAPLATQAQLAPLATQAQLAPLATQAQLAPLATQAQLAPLATQANVNAQFAAAQANINAQFLLIQNQLALIGVPAIAGAATAIVQAVAAARAQNAHDHRGVAYIAVPRDDGTLPPNWPAGFNRDDLVEGPIGVIDTVLNDYGLPHGAPAGLFVRRNALARYIGAPRA